MKLDSFDAVSYCRRNGMNFVATSNEFVAWNQFFHLAQLCLTDQSIPDAIKARARQ